MPDRKQNGVLSEFSGANRAIKRIHKSLLRQWSKEGSGDKEVHWEFWRKNRGEDFTWSKNLHVWRQY